MNKQKLILFVLLLFSLGAVSAQRNLVKTNSLYLATTTPNIGVEFYLGSQTTLSFLGAYNPFEFKSVTKDGLSINPKLRHFLISPEFKYWFCKAYEGGALGFNLMYGGFNVGGISFIKALENFRYQGTAYGGGISYNYHWAIGGRWGLEFGFGIGYIILNYKKYECGACGDFLGEYKRNYIGPTKVSLSFAYFIN